MNFIRLDQNYTSLAFQFYELLNPYTLKIAIYVVLWTVNSVALVRERTIPIEGPPIVDEILSRGQRGGSPTVVNLSFLDRRRYFDFK
jgi:hypothetical protein